MRDHLRLYGWLFCIHLWISTFTFGGGYVVVPMVRRAFVNQKGLFTEEELMEMAAVAQSTPGAIAVNLAALTGDRVAGLPGVWISGFASVLPPLVLLSAISTGYDAFAANVLVAAVLKGMQAGVAALIVDLVADMTRMILKERSLFYTLMMPAAFLLCMLHMQVALILLGCCVLCILRVWRRHGREDA